MSARPWLGPLSLDQASGDSEGPQGVRGEADVLPEERRASREDIHGDRQEDVPCLVEEREQAAELPSRAQVEILNVARIHFVYIFSLFLVSLFSIRRPYCEKNSHVWRHGWSSYLSWSGCTYILLSAALNPCLRTAYPHSSSTSCSTATATHKLRSWTTEVATGEEKNEAKGWIEGQSIDLIAQLDPSLPRCCNVRYEVRMSDSRTRILKKKTTFSSPHGTSRIAASDVRITRGRSRH